MRVGAFFLAAALALAVSWDAHAEDASADKDQRPPTGIDALGSGIALTAIGTLSFATAPICKSGVVNPPEQDSCFKVSFFIGAPVLALGIPIIVYGAVQHAKYAEWARRHPALAGLSFSPTPSGGAVGWSARF